MNNHRSGCMLIATLVLLSGLSVGALADPYEIVIDFGGTAVKDPHGTPIWGNPQETVMYATSTGDTYQTGPNYGNVFKVDISGPAAQLTVLHQFTGAADDGGRPFDDVLLYNSRLYGLTAVGGASGKGTLFRMDTSGDNFSLLHSFNGADGDHPYGGLELVGTTLYGMTSGGGAGNLGAIFSYNLSTDTYTLLKSLDASTGTIPHGSLTYYDGDL